ncbi:MAG: hypothetical protein MMC33_010585 [Icmadophila ericetorum]|nr:hypothetical protein [Icmadophila ericetorum]
MASRIPQIRPQRSDATEGSGGPNIVPRKTPLTGAAASTSRIPTTASSALVRPKVTPRRVDEKSSATRDNRTPTMSTPLRPPNPSSRSLPKTMIPSPSMTQAFGTHTEITANAYSIPRQRNRLKRKPSSVDNRTPYAESESTTPSREQKIGNIQATATSEPTSLAAGYTDPSPDTVLGISMPAVSYSTSQIPSTKPTTSAHATSSSRMAYFMSRQIPHKLSTNDLVPPAPNFVAGSSSASTRASESPGPFSRTSTPTSVSSHSPGIALPPKFASRVKPPSAFHSSRPPVTRRRTGPTRDEENESQGLPILRESVTSSSSSSTIRGVQIDRPENSNSPAAVSNRQHSRTPPVAPLRISSKRLPRSTRGSSDEERSETENAREERTMAGPETRQPQASEPKEEQHKTRLKSPTSYYTSKIPPPRPSREGTSSLNVNNKPSPVIQSNLDRLATSGHKRRESVEKALQSAAKSPASATTPSSASSLSRIPSKFPPPTTAQTSTTSSNKITIPKESSLPRSQLHTKLQKPEPASLPKSPSKLSLFSRWGKQSIETESAASIERSLKKGPAAGTGHEGYGKYARRGRSGSTSTTASRGRSTSSDRHSQIRPSSRKSSFGSQSDHELDDFYRERLSPVILKGKGEGFTDHNIGSEIYRTSSEDSSAIMAPSSAFSSQVSLSRSVDEFVRQPTLEPSLLPPPSESLSTGPGYRRIITQPSARDDQSEFSKLAIRRSFNRLQNFGDGEPLKLPPPINTQALAASPTLDSRDTIHSSVITDSTDISEGHEGNWLRSKKPVNRVKFTQRWNIFQRAQTSPKKAKFDVRAESQANVGKLPALVSKVPEARTVAHYALLDETEQSDPGTLEDMLRDIEEDLEIGKQKAAGAATEEQQNIVKLREPSMLLPSPPQLQGNFQQQNWPSPPKVSLNQAQPRQATPKPTVLSIAIPTAVTTTAIIPAIVPVAAAPPAPMLVPAPALVPTPPRKPSRLPQVGRIPQVVSKRDRPHNPPPLSFSRPFQRRPTLVQEAEVMAESTIPRTSNETTTSVPETSLIQEPASVQEILSTSKRSLEFERLAHPSISHVHLINNYESREFLAFSPRKGSEVSGESSSSGILSYAITAIKPSPETPLSEDEVWNEFDDLLDRVVSPTMLPPFPEIYEQPESEDQFINLKGIYDSLSQAPKRESPIIKSTDSSSGSGGSTILAPRSPRLTIRQGPAEPPVLELPPRPDSQQTPLTPFSYTDLIAGYGTRGSFHPNIRDSAPSESHYSYQSVVSRTETQAQPATDYEQIGREVMAQKERSEAMARNFRFTAVLTSRWLSFNRVLFSPAHDEVLNNIQDKILVLDGLGNDDWSSYCASTYPTAIVYNLGTVRPPSTRVDSLAPRQTPPNHRQMNHPGIGHPFPFPKGFFTVVVFRFPTANPEAAYYNAVSECKRVLRPGGYIEMSILDIDMVNMGHHTRKAVRNLKTRMHVAEPEISLSPASDEIQKMLGRRGFENLNRCMVGVPVAASISDSRAGSLDESFTSEDFLEETTTNEATMAKMVPKVGRWWWSKCYEGRHIQDGISEPSVWNDRQVLKECEDMDTGFKMLICYAQKLSNPRRRTVSV